MTSGIYFPQKDIPDFEIPKLKALTLDIETYIDEEIRTNSKNIIEKVQVFKLLAICFYDGRFSYKFYRADFATDPEMLDACFDKVFSKNYSGYNLYMHNGANFDMIFFINYLLSRDDLKISRVLYKNSKFLQLDINKEITLKDGG